MKLLTSHKCHCSHLVLIWDSSHSHSLTSLQWSRLLANGCPYRKRENSLVSSCTTVGYRILLTVSYSISSKPIIAGTCKAALCVSIHMALASQLLGPSMHSSMLSEKSFYIKFSATAHLDARHHLCVEVLYHLTIKYCNSELHCHKRKQGSSP